MSGAPQAGIHVAGSSAWVEALALLDGDDRSRVLDDVLMLGSGFIEVTDHGTAYRIDPARVKRHGRKWVVT